MNLTQSSEFGWFRRLFWPIYNHEKRKIVPMFLMLVLICFNYSILRNMKDALVVTAQDSGAEVIPFIKVWVMLPMAVILTLVFTKLSNKFSQERVFYIMTTGFLSFYALFLFVLYPAADYLHPHSLCNFLESVLPTGAKGFIAMVRNWTFTGFYVMAELWSCIVLTVLFWGFANEVTRIGEAKRFYAVFNVGCNLAAICAGQVGANLSRDAREESLFLLIGTVIICGIITMGIFRWMNKAVLNDPSFDALHQARVETKKANQKLSVWECFSYVANSRYLLCIAAIVVGYNLVIHIVEVVWKDQLRQLYPSFSDYNSYLGNLTTGLGLLSMLMAIFIPKMIERMGWTRTALITPSIMLVTGLAFFGLLFFQDYVNSTAILGILSATPLSLVVLAGATQNLLSKAAKYSVFDATKEMSFIPLEHDYKLKGKAAIDGVGSRLGKSGGSMMHQGLLIIFGSLTASAGYVAAILFVVIVLWIIATRALGKQFNALVGDKLQEPMHEESVEEPQTTITLEERPAATS